MEIKGFSEKQQHILRFLMREKEGVTIEQFSKLLDISRTAIHQHMTVLERDGYVKKFASKQTGGRPGTLFVLTEKGVHLFPKHYSLVAEMLIHLIKDKLGEDELINFLQTAGISLSEAKKESIKNKPIDEKIQLVVDFMQEMGYDAHTTKDEEGLPPMIDAYNCIFHELAYKNEEVCQLDMALLSSLLDRKIERTCCMAKGGVRCRFKVLPKD